MPPTPTKAGVSKQKRKEAKQKKALFLLVPLLLIVAFIQVPKLMKSGGESTTAAATTGAADSAPASTDAAAPAPADTSGGALATAPAAPVVPTGPVQLVDSDLPPATDPGQLQTFDRFVSKDPFQQQVKPPAGGQPTGPTPGKGGTTPPGDTGTTTPEVLPNAAELVVNGVLESVKIGASFPASDPTFRLVSIDGKTQTIHIGLVRGSFSTGVSTIELEVGKKLTLVSQPDGIRYEIELQDLTTMSGDSTTTPASATPTDATTPASTTPSDSTTPADSTATTTSGQ